MILTPSIEKAIKLACQLHRLQRRKDGDRTPYVSHPFSVAWILGEHTKDPAVIVAGLLHDTTEDVKGYTLEDIKRDFGSRVADIVKGVSEDKNPSVKIDKKATWGQRKEQKLASLRKASYEVLLVCAADHIHNLRSCVYEFKETGRKPWEKFNAPVGLQVWYHQEFLGILKVRFSLHPLFKELEEVLQAFLVVSGQAHRF